jgi:hypothetical protein
VLIEEGSNRPRLQTASSRRHMYRKRGRNIRVLVYETRGIVHLVMDDHEEVLLGVVLGNIRVGIFLVGHCEKLRLEGFPEGVEVG